MEQCINPIDVQDALSAFGSLELNDNDILVFLSPRLLTSDQVERILFQVKQEFPHNRAIVLEDGMTIGKITKGE